MPNAPTCLKTDASETAIGAALQQYTGSTVEPAETRYSTF